MPAAPSPKAFRTLAEAVDFIAACIEANDPQRLSACFTSPEWQSRRETLSSSFVAGEFMELRQRHSEISLRNRYRGREFPSEGKTLSLGGHFAELGCLHIDFVRGEQGWNIENIWLCL